MKGLILVHNFEGTASVDGKTALCTQINTEEAKKVKHTAYLSNGMEC